MCYNLYSVIRSLKPLDYSLAYTTEQRILWLTHRALRLRSSTIHRWGWPAFVRLRRNYGRAGGESYLLFLCLVYLKLWGWQASTSWFLVIDMSYINA